MFNTSILFIESVLLLNISPSMYMETCSLMSHPLFLLNCRYFFTSASYLGCPRINFAGHFRADVNTRNNFRCNYHLNKPLYSNLNKDWGFNGTNEFELVQNAVTSVVYQNGTLSLVDPVVGKFIIGNLDKPFAKIVDLDTDAQDRSTIYGMQFGIAWSEIYPRDSLRFIGNWTPSIIAQNAWPRVKCYDTMDHMNELVQRSFPISASSTAIITDIDWNDDLGGSVVLNQLKAEAENASGKLSVRVTLFYYTQNMPKYVALNATLGYVIGTIGIHGPSDTLNVPGQRIMDPTGKDPLGLEPFLKEDSCFNQKALNNQPWIFYAPFSIDFGEKRVHIDFSNSLPTNLSNALRNLGELKLGILVSGQDCVCLIGNESIPYLSNNWLQSTGGIYTKELTSSQLRLLKFSKLVLAQVVESNEGSTLLCQDFSFAQHDLRVELLLSERPYFVRPNGLYIDRLDEGSISSQKFYVTYFGQPAPNVQVKIRQANKVIPVEGVKPDSYLKRTDCNGYVSFDFSIAKSIPYPRQYLFPPCDDNTTTIPIDGQVYYFKYASCPHNQTCHDFEYNYMPTFLAFSNVTYISPYTWVKDVQPILASYAHLTPVMRNVLDMGDYFDVIQPRNIELMKFSLKLSSDDPSHMPTTRNLSPAKRKMLLKWLDNPQYSDSDIPPTELANTCILPDVQFPEPIYTHFEPPRCRNGVRHMFSHSPVNFDTFFAKLSEVDDHMINNAECEWTSERPLLGFQVVQIQATFEQSSGIFPSMKCNLENLRKQLQTALIMEFSTIPVYLTSLYSIVNGCNQQIYQRIRSVVRQEMLHLTQIANTLIAMGGEPRIDSSDVIPMYPTNLPGGVLPKVKLSIKKLSLKHVYNTFMAIEVPQCTNVGNPPIVDSNLYTIGSFYQEISNCIDFLNKSDVEIFEQCTINKQVQFPWTPKEHIGDLVPVTDSISAIEGIRMIVSQGEGSDLLHPKDIENNTFAHFFQFEEIVCQKQLKKLSDSHYSYSGAPIPFNPKGVWPMRDNPTAKNILQHTNCYTEARAFHGVYRSLLRKLQEAFSGRPKEINSAVKIMESLQIHAKKTMMTKFTPTSLTTCGPVWDYEWPIP